MYWAAGETKYNRDEPEAPTAPKGGKRTVSAEVLARGQQIDALIQKYNMAREDYAAIVKATKAKSPAEMTTDEFSEHLKAGSTAVLRRRSEGTAFKEIGIRA